MVNVIRYDNPCAECLIGKAGDKCATKSHGPRKAKILVVAGAPQNGKIINNRNMARFAQALRAQGFGRDDFVFVSAVRCAYHPDNYLAKERNQIVKPCREYMTRVISRMKPDIIIGLGALAARQVEGRVVKIMKRRGMPAWSEEHNAWTYYMLDPGFVDMYPQHEATFNVDARTLREFIEAGFDLERMGQQSTGYREVDDLEFLIKQKPSTVSIDVETQGLRPKERKTKLLSVQLSIEPGSAYIVWWDKTGRQASRRQKSKIRRQLRTLLRNPRTSVVGQNAKFDANWIYQEMGFRYRIDHDTLMLTTLLDENSNDKGLDHQVKLHVPEMAGYNDFFNSKYDKSDMDSVPIEDFIEYGCGDPDASLRLLHALLPRVKQDPGLWAHYRRVSIPGLNAFVGVEARGMCIDRAALEDFAEVLESEVEELKQSLLDRIPRAVKRQHAVKGIKFSRSEFVKDVLFSEQGFGLEPVVWTKSTERLAPEHRQPSTSSKDHLPYFFDNTTPIIHHLPASQARTVERSETVGQFVMDLAEYVKNERLLSTNVLGFRDKYMVGDYIYPSYSLWTTVTGRTSSNDPNGQNFPKRGKAAKAYRRIFIPPPGMIQIEADLSQAELRIAGDMAGDQEMIRIYNAEGGDIHTETALIVMGIPMAEFRRLPRAEQKLARFKAKAVNFGFLYGMGWRKFIVYAKTQYGVEFTDQEARRIRDAFFHKYDQLEVWHRDQRQIMQRDLAVRSYSGRIRHLPMINSFEEGVQREAERQGINSPVQEFASSLGVMAMGRLDREIDGRYLALTGFVHDALYAYCPPEYLEWGAKTIKRYMETNDIRRYFDRTMDIPIVADVGFGWNGAEMWEMGHVDFDAPYDFDALARANADEDTEEIPDFRLPPQEVPPNNGLLPEPLYEISA